MLDRSNMFLLGTLFQNYTVQLFRGSLHILRGGRDREDLDVKYARDIGQAEPVAGLDLLRRFGRLSVHPDPSCSAHLLRDGPALHEPARLQEKIKPHEGIVT